MVDRETRATGAQPGKAADPRADRLAQALRANLKRRKDQARARDATPPQSHDERPAENS